MKAKYPKYDKNNIYEDEYKKIESLKEYITKVRNIKVKITYLKHQK